MNLMTYCESMDLELKCIYESCELAVARAYTSYMEEGLYPYLHMESGEKKTGGLVGFVMSALKAIMNMLGSILEKLSSFLFGVEKGENSENTIEFKSPEAIIKFNDKYHADSKEMIKKASKGEVSIEEAEEFVKKEKINFDSIKETAIGAATFFGVSKILDNKISSWKEEVDELYNTFERENEDGTKSIATVDAERAIAKSATSENKRNIIDQTTKLLINDLRRTNTTVAQSLEELIKLGYQERIIRNKLMAGSEAMTDPKKLKKMQKDARKRDKEGKKYRDKLDEMSANIDHATEVRKNIADSDSARIAKNKAAENRNFDDVNNYVHEPDLKKRGYDSKQKASDSAEGFIRRNLTKLKNLSGKNK